MGAASCTNFSRGETPASSSSPSPTQRQRGAKAAVTASKDDAKNKSLQQGGQYNGEWKDSQRHGTGKFTYPNGDWYEGDWLEGKATGQGKFWTRASTYNGSWDQDLKHGYGEETFEDGHVYCGEYRQGQRHGKGKLTRPDKSVYEGEFADNNQEGYGTLKTRSKHKYTGMWVENYMHGQGRYEWPDGTSYDGQYNMNVKEGDGIFMGKHGERIDCSWWRGKPTGPVKFRGHDYDAIPMVWQDWHRLRWLRGSRFCGPALSLFALPRLRPLRSLLRAAYEIPPARPPLRGHSSPNAFVFASAEQSWYV